MSANQKENPLQSKYRKADTTDRPPSMERRKFLLHTAAGITASLFAGHLFWRADNEPVKPMFDKPEPPVNAAASTPLLRTDVLAYKQNETFVLERRSQTDNSLHCRCTVNETGAEIFRHLNGRHTIEDIAERIAMAGIGADKNAAYAEIALFVAQLGSIGFLAEPYYVQIYETYDT